jgi:DNA mismatch endonuclease (patch repair protein)
MNMDPEQRSRVMRTVKRSGTRLESRFAAILGGVSDAYERQAADLPGTPDFVFRKSRVALFLDSCFWHGCPVHLRPPASNQTYWAPKIDKNRERDARQTAELGAMGWHVVRIWEHELKEPTMLVARIKEILAGAPATTRGQELL